ncbi:hypothetical protein OUZ56_013025 [Daphnia magna]|uniref:Uncharacterized protein n=1 Tax=Daphnia magna TaxID=35525 RepID=A0ABQ9Z4Q3_9CRUS|nr:hypothetical protein OUZ56_013025 [Daphnia magna]
MYKIKISNGREGKREREKRKYRKRRQSKNTGRGDGGGDRVTGEVGYMMNEKERDVKSIKNSFVPFAFWAIRNYG